MKIVLLLLRIVALTVILFVCYAIAGAAVRLPANTQDPAAGTLALIVVCVLQTLVLSYLILRSSWSGMRLALAIALVFYGVATFMPQIESAVFITSLPAGTLPRLFVMGALVAIPFAALSVLVLGKRKADPVDLNSTARLTMPASEWAWKLALIAVAYVTLYLSFGYFIAWRNPALRAYYGDIDPGSFTGQIGHILRDMTWLVPFQIVRAMCWVAIAIPVMKMLKGDRLETALALGFLFAVVMNSLLLLPNPYMPESVRMSHLVETASSNFIFGVLVGWLLTERHTVARPSLAQDTI
jgi:hypothetical protein